MPNKAWTKDELESAIIVVKDRFLERDDFLLRIGVHEVTLTSKFAMYLQSCFDDWNVDCEYNRDGYEVKTLNGDIVRPDIAVHERGRKGPEFNLLVIEGKPSNRTGNIDELKDRLALFKEKIGFQFAVLLIFDVTNITIIYEFI